MEITLIIAFFAVLFLAAWVVETVKERKGRDGEDKARIRRAAAARLENSALYTIAYAHYMDVKLGYRSSTSSYYNYIVAFRPGELYVIPIQFSGKEIVSQPAVLLTPEHVGEIRFQDKKRTWITFCGRDGAELCTFGVVASNTSDGPFQPLNIQQKEEAEKFKAFLREFAAKVRAAADQRR
ncbi:hypothetical protein [Intestinimonas sp.]|uniref:hypothetical protein n=1 Tax=Intestinimonas sp. TaxID=1965293 RepID=UPI00261654F3|nr:hypothetical protein [Intestinimonas sp.]